MEILNKIVINNIKRKEIITWKIYFNDYYIN